MSGSFTMRELQAETGWPVEWQARETVATWTMRHLGHIPKRDDTTVVGEFRLTVLGANTERARRRSASERVTAEGKDLVA